MEEKEIGKYEQLDGMLMSLEKLCDATGLVRTGLIMSLYAQVREMERILKKEDRERAFERETLEQQIRDLNDLMTRKRDEQTVGGQQLHLALDGSMSPEEIQGRMDAFNQAFGKDMEKVMLTPEEEAEFGEDLESLLNGQK